MKINPIISEHMKKVSAKRKNPYHNFVDKEKARQAGKLGAAKRWNKHEAQEETKSQPGQKEG